MQDYNISASRWTRRMAADYTANSGWDIAYVTAQRTALIFLILTGCGFGGSVGLFINYRILHARDRNLNSLQGSMVDPIGIRYIVAMSVTAGTVVFWIGYFLVFFLQRRKWLREDRLFNRALEYTAELEMQDPRLGVVYEGHEQGKRRPPRYGDDDR